MTTQTEFDRFLAWLDPDRDQAGARYELLRRKLITFFMQRGSCQAEDLTDETINRVIIKLPEIEAKYVGDRFSYFFGVARFVYLESLNRIEPEIPDIFASDSDDSDNEAMHECLNICLSELSPDNHDLIIGYYQHDKIAKIKHRAELAKRLEIAPNAMRIRVSRIKEQLRTCVDKCLDRPA